jgi:hypothetical protein
VRRKDLAARGAHVGKPGRADRQESSTQEAVRTADCSLPSPFHPSPLQAHSPNMMPTTINSLPHELILQVLESVAPTTDQNELNPARRSPGPKPKPMPNPLLITSLVNHRFRRLSQQILFRKVRLRSGAQARQWRRTLAGVYTTEMALEACEGEILTLSHVFAPSKFHQSTGKSAKIRVLIIDWNQVITCKGGLSALAMLDGEYEQVGWREP